MKFSTDELMPFFEVRTGMSKHLDEVQAGKEIVITRHGKPEGALLSAAQLYRYRELDRLMEQLLDVLSHQIEATGAGMIDTRIAKIVSQIKQIDIHATKRDEA